MPHFTYLIIGGGMTADSAARAIRELDQKGTMGIISAEKDPPYDRPPLTKALWKGKELDSVWRHTETQQVDLRVQVQVTGLDPAGKRVTDDRGQSYTYDKLLLATGGSPRRLEFGGDHIIYFRTVGDYRRLRELADRGRRFVVIGGGFIGSELAAALAMNQKQVTMLFPGKAVCSRTFPPDLANFLNDYYTQKGVRVLPGESAVGLEQRGNQLLVKTKAHGLIEADGVVAGLGIAPNTDLARAAGLEIGDGLVVDEFLRASKPDIYSAGDVASFHNPALNQRIRVEHEDNANTMGRAAGRNMAGKAEPYLHLPFFYSDLFDLGYEAVGELDSRLEVVADWKEKYREGILYFLREKQVRGVLLWNVWGQVDTARGLVGKPYVAGSLKMGEQ